MSTCADINELLSDHLDDRLDPATLSKVETHLGRCPSCSAELEAWRLIGERMRAAPPEPVAPEFASRIRAAAQAPRPRRGVKFFLQRAAAAVLLLATLVTSYFIGHHGGRADARADDLVRLGSTPIPVRPARNEGERLRAARELVSDLRVIDRVPPAMRRPLLRAELEHFDLHQWAGRHLQEETRNPASRSMADLIRRLDITLHAHTTVKALFDLRDEALLIDLVQIPLPKRLHDLPSERDLRSRRGRIVRRVSRDLSTEMRDAIDHYLSIKESIIHGRHFAAVLAYQDETSPLHIIGPAVEISIANAFKESGFHKFARPFLLPLMDHHPEIIELLKPLLDFENEIDIRIDVEDLHTHIRRAFERFGLGGDLNIEHDSDSGVFSIRAIVPKDREEDSKRKRKQHRHRP